MRSQGNKPENWASRPKSDIYERCEKWYTKIRTAYENRRDADQAIDEYWNIYNAQPDDNQVYKGNSQTYIPAVRDAINARAKRTLKQLFPTKYQHVKAVSTTGQEPSDELSMLEHYIRTTRLKSVVRSLLIAGDVTGQWGLYVDWGSSSRVIKNAIRRNPILQDKVDGQQVELTDPTETTREDRVEHIEGPEIIDFPTQDLIVLPPTAESIEKAELTCLKLRMSKQQVKEMVEDGVFYIRKDTDLDKWVKDHKGNERQNAQKTRTSDAGIKTEGTLEYALIFWAQVYMKLDGDHKELVDIYYAGENDIVGIVRSENWGQRRSIISAPIERVSGSFNGISKIESVKYLQWDLNDTWNMGQDSAMYSLLPVVMTDPSKNPNYAMMVYGLAAVWPVSPNDTQFATFPQLWKDSVARCQAIKAQINESLDVNPMMMGVMPQGRKNNALMQSLQQEQSVSITDNAEAFEQNVLNPLMEMIYELDCQYRDTDLEVIVLGEIGQRERVQTVQPLAWGERIFFFWCGTEFMMNMQRMQQQVATMNVLRGIPPQQLNGLTLDITPILKELVNNSFGIELGARILIDNRHKLSVPPQVEDEMMVNGIPVDTHEADDDIEHLQVHQMAAKMSGDANGLMRQHIAMHAKQLQAKRAASMPPPQGQPGLPGGAGPGVPGTPRIGAQPAQPRPVQNPPGMPVQPTPVG